MILWLIACGTSFVLGKLTGEGKINLKWVRGAAGKARDAVFGSRPAAATARERMERALRQAPESDPFEQPLAEVSPTPPKNPINPLKIAGEVGRFIWHWRHFIVAGLIALVVWGLAARVVSFVTCPFDGILWCASDNDAAALENERINTQVAELQAQVGALSAQLAENSANDRRRVDHVIAEANQELAHAVETDDFEGAYSIYRRAYDGVWHDLEPSGEPDPAPSGFDPLPGASASPV